MIPVKSGPTPATRDRTRSCLERVEVERAGITFGFDPDKETPYWPMLESKPVTVIVSAGDGAMHPGGELWTMNHFEPHLSTALGFIGLSDLEFVRVGYDEYQDERLRHSLAEAERRIDELAAGRAEVGSVETVGKS